MASTKKLIETLKTAAAWEARRDAAGALGAAKDKSAVPALIEAMQHDTSWVVQFFAADALGEIGDAQALAPLTAALRAPKDTLQSHAAKALAKLGQPGIDTLVQALNDPATPQRPEICWVLTDAIRAQAFDPVLAVLKDADPRVRVYAARGLGYTGDKRAVPHLIQALEDDAARTAAATALGELGDPGAVTALAAALENCSEASFRQAATKSLEKLGWQPESANSLAFLLGQRKYDEAAQLGEVALEPLLRLLHDPNEGYRAAQAVATMGALAVGPLCREFEQAQGDFQYFLARTLKQVDDPQAQQVVDAFVEKRKAALKAYFRGMAEDWWRRNKPREAYCDSCSGPLKREDAYYFVTSQRMRCPRCTDDSLANWSLYSDYFGKGEIERALAYTPVSPPPTSEAAPSAPLSPVAADPAAELPEAEAAPSSTILYAFLAESGASGLGLFGQVVTIPASDADLKELIRVRAGVPDAEVIIVTPDQWKPPKLANLEPAELGAKLNGITTQVVLYFKRAKVKNVPSIRGLINDGMVLPNALTGKVYFVYKLQRDEAGQSEDAKKWWEFWKS